MKDEIFIIGAGVGGLTTGALLANQGKTVHILEKSSKLGGRTASKIGRAHV